MSLNPEIQKWEDQNILEKSKVPFETTLDANEQAAKYNIDGKEFWVYTPKNMNPNTPTHIYTHGSGGLSDVSGHDYWANPKGAMDILLEEQPDTLVIMPIAPDGSSHDEGINTIMKGYGVNGENVTCSGFSAYDIHTFEMSIFTKDSTNTRSKITTLIDPAGAFLKRYNTKSVADKFKETGDILMVVGRGTDEQRTALMTCAKNGINTLLVTVDPNHPEYYNQERVDGKIDRSSSFDHVTYNQHFFKIFLDFVTGNGTLPPEGYIYEIPRVEDETWEYIDVSKIEDQIKLLEYFGYDFGAITELQIQRIKNINFNEIKSDNSVLAAGLNSIRENINKFNQLSDNASFISTCDSTSKVPSEIPPLVSELLLSNTILLLKLSDDIREFAKVGNAFDDVEKEISQETERLVAFK